MKNNIKLNVYVDEGLCESLKVLAESHNKSVSSYCNRILNIWLRDVIKGVHGSDTAEFWPESRVGENVPEFLKQAVLELNPETLIMSRE